jgi:hypothetical protein
MKSNNNTTQNTKLTSNPKLGFWLNVATMYKQQSGITNHADLVHHLCKNGFAKHNAEIQATAIFAIPSLSEPHYKEYNDGANGYD